MSFKNTSVQNFFGLITFSVTGVILSLAKYQTEKTKIAKERALSDLESALRSRDEFISIASHELKTPLTALKLKLDLLQRQIQKETNSERMNEMVKSALQQAFRMNELIEKLLDITQIRAGVMELNYEEISIWDSVQKIISQTHEPMRAAQCELKVEIDKSTTVLTDRIRFEQILTNLLTNAIKYAPSSLIEILASIQGDELSIGVRDHGPGMEESVLKSIFNRFDRGRAPKNTQGLGLGLYIAKSLAVAQGGDLRAESTLGRGTLFQLILPLQRIKKIDQVKV